MNECGNAPIKLYLQNSVQKHKTKTETQRARWIWPTTDNMPTPALNPSGIYVFILMYDRHFSFSFSE